MASKIVPDGTAPPAEQEDTIQQLPPQPTSISLHDDHDDHEEEPEAEESTPLIRRDTERNASSQSPKRSWWTIISIAILLLITVNIIVFAFVMPSAVENYTAEATSYSIQNIEVLDYTDSGVISNSQVNIAFDASRVSSNGIRNLGLFTTGIFRHVHTKPCLVSVLLPQYNGAQVAIITLPALKVDVRNRHVNILDVESNVTIMDNSLAVQLAGDFLAGRKQEILAIGETDVYIKAGIIPLGTHHVRQQFMIKGR